MKIDSSEQFADFRSVVAVRGDYMTAEPFIKSALHSSFVSFFLDVAASPSVKGPVLSHLKLLSSLFFSSSLPSSSCPGGTTTCAFRRLAPTIADSVAARPTGRATWAT